MLYMRRKILISYEGLDVGHVIKVLTDHEKSNIRHVNESPNKSKTIWCVGNSEILIGQNWLNI